MLAWRDWRIRVRLGGRPILEELGLVERIGLGPFQASLYRISDDIPAKKKEPNWILGICGSFHDSAAVLLRDGKLVAALEEERITRVKHDGSPFPVHATLRLLTQMGLVWSDICHLALGWNYNQYESTRYSKAPGIEFFSNLHRSYASEHCVLEEEVPRRDVLERNCSRFRCAAVVDFLKSMADETGTSYIPMVAFVRHHWAHAASAYYASGFQEPTLVLTVDGYGDTETTTVWMGRNGNLRLIESMPIPHSLGWVYASMTEYLGFKPLSGEGEVMGLAPYGVPQNRDEEDLAESLEAFMNEFVRLEPRGKFGVNSEYVYFGDFRQGRTRVSTKLADRLGSLVPRGEGKPDPGVMADRPRVILARVLQRKIEDVIVHITRHFLQEDHRTRGTQAVALAGGVAFNINANSRLIAEDLISLDRLFIQPAAGDAGAALGAAMVVAREMYSLDPSFRMRRVDLGPAYSDQDIQAVLDAAGLKNTQDYEILDDEDTMVSRVAELLACSHVVAWFQGGSEFGPRALGFRSVLLNPADPRANELANRVKQRDYWRPSAISVAVEHAGKYVEEMTETREAPFMTLVFRLKSESYSGATIRSGVHLADGSTRLQTVARDQNPIFWRLLHKLGELTGVPAVVNTSFNRNEPLVENPEGAIRTFARMEGVDFLVMGCFLVKSRVNILPSTNSPPRSRLHRYLGGS